MSRKTARVAAMQMVYERLSGGQGGDETLQMVYDELRAEGARLSPDDPGVADRAWIEKVLSGVLSCLEDLDARISAASSKWSISRMAAVDLAIMRMAAWEILYENDPDVPGSVAISEAVELANTYSEPDSGRFVNGILGTILRGRDSAGVQADEGASPESGAKL